MRKKNTKKWSMKHQSEYLCKSCCAKLYSSLLTIGCSICISLSSYAKDPPLTALELDEFPTPMTGKFAVLIQMQSIDIVMGECLSLIMSICITTQLTHLFKWA